MFLLKYQLLRRSTVILLLLLTTLFSPAGSAQLSVSRSILQFDADEPVQDVDVVNGADHRIFVDLSIAQIVDPETDSPERVELTDPRTAPVLVSPTQMMLLPGQTKRLRVILRKLPQTVDDVYRLTLKPSVGKIELSADGNSKKSALKVLIGYDLLLVAKPENAAADLHVSRTETSMLFENRGNSNILLRRISQCDVLQQNCEDLQGTRLYAGQMFSVTLPKKGAASEFPVQVWQSEGGKSSVSVY